MSMVLLILSINTGNQPDIPANQRMVHLVSDYQGVKLYKVLDEGRWIYFSDASGTTSWEVNRLAGKSTVTEYHSVQNKK